MFIRALFFLSVFLGYMGVINSAHAQTSITLSGLSSNVEYAEGKDFADQELMNRWDMKEISDIGWQEGQSDGKILAPGVWQSTNQKQGGYLFPLFPGFEGTLPGESPQGNKSSPKFGFLHPIDASRYNYLCYQASVSPSSLVVYWSTAWWPNGQLVGASNDTWYSDTLTGAVVTIPRTGSHIRCFDMTNLSASFEQFGGSWSGLIRGLRLDTSLTAPAGATTTINWIRLVNPTSAPVINLNWTLAGGNPGGVHVLYADNDAAGYNGVPIAYFRSTQDPGNYALRTAALPPGDWYFYLKSQPVNGNGTLNGSGVNSNYTARLRIRAHSDFNFLSPSELSGTEEYFTQNGNPLDMSGPEDVPNINTAIFPQVLRQFINWSFQPYVDAVDGKIFQGLAEPANAYPGQNESDNQVWAPVNVGNPIDPRRYCHFGIRFAADMSQFPNHAKFVEEGGVLRPVGWKTDVMGVESMDPGVFVVYPGYAEYHVNLCKMTSVIRGMLWKDISVVRNFRVDPLETGIFNTGLYNWFFIDWIKLVGENYSSGSYDVKYTVNGGTGPFNITFFRDDDRSGFNGTQIGSASVTSPGQYSFIWNTTGLPDGASYYVYARIQDGMNDNYVYSSEPVIIGSYRGSLPLTRRTVSDYDGDGKTDAVVLRRGSPASRVCTRNPRTRRTTCRSYPAKLGTIFVNRSTAGFTTYPLLPVAYSPVAPDLDGDTKADFGTVLNVGSVQQWSIRKSGDNSSYVRNFGVPGDVPVIGDWNGNLVDEIGVFRKGLWYILDERDVMLQVGWGLPGDIANQADFDGDSRTDLAVYRPSLGQWFIFGSKDGKVYSPLFGLAEDIPVAADYDGDGKADVAIYRPSSGLWIIHPSAGGPDIVRQWGLFSDIPKRGLDWDGDGKPELTVFRPSNGWWYTYNVVTGQANAFQFGIPGDLTPTL